MANEKELDMRSTIREILTKGFATKEVELYGVKFVIRSLSTNDIVVLTALKERSLSNRIEMSQETFRSLDSILKVAFSLVEINGEKIEPQLDDNYTLRLAKMALGFVPNQPEEWDEFVNEYVLPRVQKLLSIPPVIYDKLVEEWNEFQTKIDEYIKSGDAKNS